VNRDCRGRNRGASRDFWDSRYSARRSGAVGHCGRVLGVAGAITVAERFGSVQFQEREKHGFAFIFFNRLKGICGILLNPNSKTQKHCPSYLLLYAHICSSSILSYTALPSTFISSLLIAR
jgi:hypothetical protein